MLQKLESDSSSSGERPTRAAPLSVRKSPSALRLATGRGERTRIGPRGVITKWSERDELFRFPNGGDPEWRTRPRHAGIVATKGVSVRMQMGKSDLLRTCLSGSESKIATVADRGNSHDVEAGMVQRKTGQYKLYEICSRQRWRGGLCRVLWRTQHLPDKVGFESTSGLEPGGVFLPTPAQPEPRS